MRQPPPRLQLHGDRSLYKQVADDLREQIQDGILRPGDPLPGEADLADYFGVGLNTIRSALSVLRGEKLIVTQKARGSSVAHPEEPLVIVLPPGAQAEIRPASEAERERLDLPVGSLVAEISSTGQRKVVPALGTIIKSEG